MPKADSIWKTCLEPSHLPDAPLPSPPASFAMQPAARALQGIHTALQARGPGARPYWEPPAAVVAALRPGALTHSTSWRPPFTRVLGRRLFLRTSEHELK